MKILRSDDGTGQLVVTLRRLELEEFGAALQAFLDIQYRTPAVDESSAEDGAVTGEAPAEEATRSAKKANAFMDLVRTALIHAGDGSAAGDDRDLVHVVSRVNEPGLALLDGTPLHPALAGTLGCDASRVTHTVSESGEPLNLGRKTRNWSTAQRRAITVRDGGHCRFVGCYNTHVDIHHIQPWEDGGKTDIDNGACECRRHHLMIHRGYRVEGDPNHELHYHRPDGSYLGSTTPACSRQLVGV